MCDKLMKTWSGVQEIWEEVNLAERVVESTLCIVGWMHCINSVVC
jgi:hypothetical protein